jgi:hypothetical protein
MVAISVAQISEFDNPVLPGDDAYSDPGWYREEFKEGCFVWAWRPATVDVINGAYVAQVGATIERFPSADSAAWWLREIMGWTQAIALPDPAAIGMALITRVAMLAALLAGALLTLAPALVWAVA